MIEAQANLNKQINIVKKYIRKRDEFLNGMGRFDLLFHHSDGKSILEDDKVEWKSLNLIAAVAFEYESANKLSEKGMEREIACKGLWMVNLFIPASAWNYFSLRWLSIKI